MENKQLDVKQNDIILFDNLFDEKYEIGVRLQDFNEAFEVHYHNYIEIVCQLNSNSIQIVDGVEYPLAQGDMIFIHPGESHRNLATESTVINLIVSEKFLSNLVLDSAFDNTIIHIKNIISTPKNTQVYSLSRLARSILNEIYFLMLNQSSSTMYYLRQKINLISFFISLEEIESFMQQSVKTKSWDLISYLEANLATATLNDFAQKCNYSPSLVSQKIKEQYEMTFVEILQEIRLKHVTRKLTDTNESIQSIMNTVGYTNKTHFYNIFKQKFNKTPNAYRKANG